MAEISIREIEEADLQRGFLESLDSLRPASGLDGAAARGILAGIIADPDHVIFVAESGGRVAGSVTLLIERKFIHGGGAVCHIEDVVVAAGMQKRGIGEGLMRFALDYAQARGCYKTVLDCLDDVAGFYEKLGFSRASNGMRLDHT